MNRQFLYLTAAVIALAAIATLAIKGCSDKVRPVAVTPLQPVKDSVDTLHRQTQMELEQLSKDFYAISSQKDSLKRIVDKQSDLLNVEKVKVGALTKEYALYRKYYDTASALVTCDTLYQRWGRLLAVVENQENTNRALQNSNDSLIANKTFAMGRLEYENATLKLAFDTTFSMFKQLTKDNFKLERKSKQRFAVGPYIGVTYTTKVVPSGGVALTYALFKF